MNVNDMHRRDLFIFIISLIITSLGLVFRNFLHYNDIVWFVSDTLGNIGGVIVGSYLFFWWAKESNFKRRMVIIFSVGFGLVVYEFLQIFLPWQTFDVKDILGTFIGVLIASIINILVMISDLLRTQQKKN